MGQGVEVKAPPYPAGGFTEDDTKNGSHQDCQANSHGCEHENKERSYLVHVV